MSTTGARFLGQKFSIESDETQRRMMQSMAIETSCQMIKRLISLHVQNCFCVMLFVSMYYWIFCFYTSNTLSTADCLLDQRTEGPRVSSSSLRCPRWIERRQPLSGSFREHPAQEGRAIQRPSAQLPPHRHRGEAQLWLLPREPHCVAQEVRRGAVVVGGRVRRADPSVREGAAVPLTAGPPLCSSGRRGGQRRFLWQGEAPRPQVGLWEGR